MKQFYDLKLSDNIPQMEQDLYFKQNKEVLWLLDFTNNYVNQVLEEENKQDFEKQDFNLMEWYIENLVEYQKIAEEIIGKEVSIGIVEKIIFWQSLEEFENFLKKNEKVVNLIKSWKENIFNKVWELFNIETKEGLEKFIQNPNNIHLLQAIKNNSISTIEELHNITIDNNTTYNIEIWYSNLSNLWACGYAEKYNINILKNKKYGYLKKLKIWKDVIWYIKLRLEKTFLSFKDIFDNKWNLIFKKWWLYTLTLENSDKEEYIDYNEIFYEEYIDISKIKWLKRKPIRKIKEYHNKELYDNFDTLVEGFLEWYENYKNK